MTVTDDDMVTIVMRDLLTKPESNLLEKGQADLVRSARKAFQELISKELVAGIEEIMQREGDRVHERQSRRAGHGRRDVHPRAIRRRDATVCAEGRLTGTHVVQTRPAGTFLASRRRR